MQNRNPNRKQMTFRWDADNSLWKQLPESQQRRCRERLAQLLRIVAQQNPNERTKRDEHQDS